ncbi:MAG: hypothetical protein LBI72_11295 [Flavobacteriaceae bacterium]|jgi:hypothetical protein|nr:hypothetical protein [Flavobacteriaceae bacterium]
MKIEKLYIKTFDSTDTILSATLSQKDEVVMVLSNGDVVRYNSTTDIVIKLFSLTKNLSITEQKFDLKSKIKLYTLDNIVVIASDYANHCIVYNGDKQYNNIHFYRGNLCADKTKYPIALYKNAEQTPHLIYAQDWNHIQILNLDTLQIITSTKSLIEERAEAYALDYFKSSGDTSLIPWPLAFDYFYGELVLSPDQKNFISIGYDFSSYDDCRVFNIDNFVSNIRIDYSQIYHGEWMQRAMCWVDNHTIAMTYNPWDELAENNNESTLKEIHLYQIAGNTSTLIEKIQIQDKDIVYNKMYFDDVRRAFVLLNDTVGFTIVSMEGQTLLQENSFVPKQYQADYRQFVAYDKNELAVYALSI